MLDCLVEKRAMPANYLNTEITLLNLAVMMDALNWVI